MKAFAKYILLLVSILILVGCEKTSVSEKVVPAEKVLFSYFSTRYADVDTDNFWERRDSLKQFYSEEYLEVIDWASEDAAMQETFNTMQEQSIETKLVELYIVENNDNTYTLSAQVLFEADDDENSHYRDYIFDVVVIEENRQIKIDNITTASNIASAYVSTHEHEHIH
ncbi:MAG: hypothetical protein IJB52_05200 [Clostridia bacterium]|nr:hypothetical protein [Clostridia bacterium]